jgi:hypothetical protein
MKGVQDKRHRKKQVLAPFPGCLGRVINMFDLSNGVVATKMLTEKAHRDGTSFSYSTLFPPCHRHFAKKKKLAPLAGFLLHAMHGMKDLMQCSMRFAVSPPGKDRSNTFKMAINPPVQAMLTEKAAHRDGTCFSYAFSSMSSSFCKKKKILLPWLCFFSMSCTV